jgi:hypothetical protein
MNMSSQRLKKQRTPLALAAEAYAFLLDLSDEARKRQALWLMKLLDGLETKVLQARVVYGQEFTELIEKARNAAAKHKPDGGKSATEKEKYPQLVGEIDKRVSQPTKKEEEAVREGPVVRGVTSTRKKRNSNNRRNKDN